MLKIYLMASERFKATILTISERHNQKNLLIRHIIYNTYSKTIINGLKTAFTPFRELRYAYLLITRINA